MRIDLILKHLYPDAVDIGTSITREGDYELRDDSDGEGIKIVQWNLPDPQPTRAQMWETENAAILAEEARIDDIAAKADLEAVDGKTIRGLREFLVSKFGSDVGFPQALRDLEVEAINHRRRIKK